MDQISLPGGTITTRLGFGCSYILPETKRLIDVAYDAGIRHFDVAPAYGRGLTESILGDVLKNKMHNVTVTTKYGISPAFSNPRLAKLARSLFQPLIARLPPVRSYISYRIAARAAKAPLSISQIELSLERSLRALKREKIDLFLLHEAESDDIKFPGLLEFFNECVEKKIIGAFGVGGGKRNINALAMHHRAFCRVLQHEWSFLDDDTELFRPDFSILYGTIAPVKMIRLFLQLNNLDEKIWSNKIGMDITENGVLERLLLKLSFETRKDSLILFSSKKERNILSSVSAIENPNLLTSAVQLKVLLEKELGHINVS